MTKIDHRENSVIAEELKQLLFKEREVFIPYEEKPSIWVSNKSGTTLRFEALYCRNLLARKLRKYKDLVNRANSLMLELEKMQAEKEIE